MESENVKYNVKPSCYGCLSLRHTCFIISEWALSSSSDQTALALRDFPLTNLPIDTFFAKEKILSVERVSVCGTRASVMSPSIGGNLF